MIIHERGKYEVIANIGIELLIQSYCHPILIIYVVIAIVIELWSISNSLEGNFIITLPLYSIIFITIIAVVLLVH